MNSYDAVVIGSGPNGLAAAVALAQAGRKTVLIEAGSTVGGGTRTEELTLPGFRHDICSAVHPLAIASPFFQNLNLDRFGLQWLTPKAAAAQTLGPDQAVLLHNDLETTVAELDSKDRAPYRNLFAPLVANWPALFGEILQPAMHIPKHPILMARFGLSAVQSADIFARRTFKGERARALFTGIAAHANAPLSAPGTAAIGMMLNTAAHARGWPIPRGGANQIAEALAKLFVSLGGEVRLNEKITSAKQLPQAKLRFFDLTPKQIAAICADELKPSDRMRLENYRYGPGVFKMDWALSGPMPWRASELLRSATVHIGASAAEIWASELAVAQGKIPERPYVLFSQPTLFDSSRAPTGQHIAWAYCHVPAGATMDVAPIIEAQIERYAPGFRDLILARHCFSPLSMEAKNANLVGGDISGGVFSLRQLLFRPFVQLNPYALPLANTYMCSSSTPPGPGVHGMCGFNAVKSAGVVTKSSP